MSLRVLIVDDHALMREGLRALLQKTRPDTSVFEAANGLEALEAVERERPDVVLMDISMPGLNGVDAVRRLRASDAGCRVIMLSMHQDEQRVVQSFRAGARGYLMKDPAVAEVSTAIDHVMRGEAFISPSAPKTVVTLLESDDEEAGPLTLLTTRQREILQLIAEGHSTKEIGYTLSLSPKTVETHRRLLMDRLGIHDVASLARLAVRAGLVSAER